MKIWISYVKSTSLLLGSFWVFSLFFTACNPSSSNSNNANSPYPYVNTTSTCPGGQVLTSYGCQNICPTNAACASYGGGYCNVPAIVNNSVCPTPGTVPTTAGCLPQCPSNPAYANYQGATCNIPVSYGNGASGQCTGSGYGGTYPGGYASGYNGGYYGNSGYPYNGGYVGGYGYSNPYPVYNNPGGYYGGPLFH